MKIIPGFKLRTIMGKPVVMGEGIGQVNFNKLITLNSSAAMLWESVEGKDFTTGDLADLLVQHYEIDRATALADAKEIADKWVEAGLVES